MVEHSFVRRVSSMRVKRKNVVTIHSQARLVHLYRISLFSSHRTITFVSTDLDVSISMSFNTGSPFSLSSFIQ